MPDLQGEITPYLEAIGTEDGSDAMLAAMRLVGTTFSIEEFTSMGKHEKYLVFAKGGVEFLVIDGVLDTIFFQLVASEDCAAHPRPSALIDGIEHGMAADEVIAALGPPLRTRRKHLAYEVGEKYLNIALQDGRVNEFCVQRRDFGADLESSDPAPAASDPAPAAPITGEITLFIDAAGTAYGDPIMIDLVDALGLRLDSHDIEDEQGDGKFLVFDSGGVDLQYRDDTLVGVLIHTGDDRRPYPRLDALVTGLSFPATRADVAAALGSAQTSLPDRDLYHERGRHVMFDYTDDTVTSISVISVPPAA